jgi:hypothetical protein
MTVPGFGGRNFRGRELQLELIDPGSVPLVRLFRHPGGEWEPPREAYRNLRADPPAGFKEAFAVLYTGSTLATVAIECGILRADARDRYTWAADLAEQYRVVRYAFSAPALFVPIDGSNREPLGLAGGQRKFTGYEPYQQAAHALFVRYGRVVHGLSWESFHRNQPGRVYALWHRHKPTIGLAIQTAAPFQRLVDDPEWKQFLLAHPRIEALTPPPASA